MDLSGVINEDADVSNYLGISPAQGRLPGYEGQQLPASTYVSARDGGAVPWSPDSPLFWGAVVLAGTFVGLIGASARVRFGKARVQGSVGSD